MNAAIIEIYTSLLKNHDWFHDYSDDHSVWVNGKNQRSALLEMQKQVDPNAAIWNGIAPDMFKLTIATPAPAQPPRIKPPRSKQ
jgi:hypothetical protein